MNRVTSQALPSPMEQRDPATVITTRMFCVEMSLLSSCIESLGAGLGGLYGSPISYHSLLHCSLRHEKLRNLSCHHGGTCCNAVSSWKTGSPQTVSQNQPFPSLCHHFQKFCHHGDHGENSSKDRDSLSLHGSTDTSFKKCALTDHTLKTKQGRVVANLNYELWWV